ncbi:MAG: hypothetical protein U0Q16_23100 [Bryobacteraceae bacterium]
MKQAKILPAILFTSLVPSAAIAQSSSSSGQWINPHWYRPDVGVYGGVQGFSNWRNDAPIKGSELTRGGAFGVRLGQDITRHWGWEGAYGYGVNNLRLFPTPGPNRIGFGPPPADVGYGARNHHLSLNPVFNIFGPESKVRPFLTAGVGALWFNPTGAAKDAANAPLSTYLGAQQLGMKYGPAFNWGGGLKVNLMRHLQLRMDARNIIAQNPHFMLRDASAGPGTVFISRGGLQSGVQLTGGVGFRLNDMWGSDSKPPQPPSAGSGTPILLKLDADRSPMAIGTVRTVTATTDAPSGAGLRYGWTVDSQPVAANGPIYNFDSSSRRPGPARVCATAAAPGYKTGSECVVFTVVEAGALPPAKPIQLSVTADPNPVMPGGTSRMSARADLPAGTQATYRWTVNGEAVAGANSADYAFSTAGKAPGTYNVCAIVSAPGFAETKQCQDVVVRACGNPSISLAPPSKGEIFLGETAPIQANVKPSECGSPVQVSWQASEGRASGGVFDSTGVAFDMSNRSKLQRKTVTITATAKDQQGNSATANTTVVVKLAPVAKRLDDIVFAAGGARVNNCGKRVLLEMVAPRLQEDPAAQVVLVGHIAEGEHAAATRVVRTKSGKRVVRRAAPVGAIDRARALNAAAVISAGEGICPTLELSRVKVAYAGSAQKSEAMPQMCGTSAQVKGKTRAAAPDAKAKFRRVEVWVVPAGAQMPDVGVPIQNAPAAEIKKKGCPK